MTAAAILAIRRRKKKEILDQIAENHSRNGRRPSISNALDNNPFEEPSHSTPERKEKSSISRQSSAPSQLTSHPPPPAPAPVAKEPTVVQTGIWKFRPHAKSWYTSARVQVGVAMLIVLNFITNVVEKEIDPAGDKHEEFWRSLEHTFNAIFLLELLVNMYAHPATEFWASSWNIFDFVVVCVGCISFFTKLDGPLKLLRCLRALRVFRLFKRNKSLNKIITMIITAIPGVINTFVVMIISISIYSLSARQLRFLVAQAHL